MKPDNRAACLLGALVSDAAALGQHWIYDIERIADITRRRGGTAAFTPIDAMNFADVPAYFAHGSRKDGMATQYGAVLRLTISAMTDKMGFLSPADYQQQFVGTFGSGGSYQGYIDGPTSGTIANIANDIKNPSGIDDDQLTATSSLPVVVLANIGNADFAEQVETAIQITNVNPAASNYGQAFAHLLSQVLDGIDLATALQATIDKADDSIKSTLQNSLDTDEIDSIAYGEVTGRACHLPMAMPLTFHILKHTSSFRDATERNIQAGGDSAGRAILIGSVLGALHGIDGNKGIPLDWILATSEATEIWAECRKFVERI